MSAALVALVATTTIEVVIVLVVLAPRGVAARRVIAVGIVANVVTHPLLWAFVSRHDDRGSTPYALAVVAGEVVVVAVEWLVLAVGLRADRLPAIELLGIVVLANAVTTAIGLTIALVR